MAKSSSGVYVIANKVNGKIYVGLSKSIQKRWAAHKHSPIATREKISAASKAAWKVRKLEVTCGW